MKGDCEMKKTVIIILLLFFIGCMGNIEINPDASLVYCKTHKQLEQILKYMEKCRRFESDPDRIHDCYKYACTKYCRRDEKQ